MKEGLLKLLGVKDRNEIRCGKLLKIYRRWFLDFYKQEIEVAKAEPLQKREALALDEHAKIRTHTIKPDDNVTNLTKKPDLL